MKNTKTLTFEYFENNSLKNDELMRIRGGQHDTKEEEDEGTDAGSTSPNSTDCKITTGNN